MADGEHIGRRPSASNALPVKVKTSTTPYQRMCRALELGRRYRTITRYLKMDEQSAPLPLQLPERISTASLELGIETAVIGALALVAHNYVRATDSIALASYVDVYRSFAISPIDCAKWDSPSS